jgi:outer membrane protein insertion porin family
MGKSGRSRNKAGEDVLEICGNYRYSSLFIMISSLFIIRWARTTSPKHAVQLSFRFSRQHCRRNRHHTSLHFASVSRTDYRGVGWKKLLAESRALVRTYGHRLIAVYGSGIVLLVLFLAQPSQARQSDSEGQSQAAYQGETIAAVDVVADPHLDVTPLLALVQQKAGQPYSEQQVQASIAALDATHRFTGVQTYITPEPKGLRLTFVLGPAYSIGIIEFPPADRHFTYIRLLQVVSFASDYSYEHPYDKERLPAAEAALEAFLNENGYFLAHVDAEVHFDDPNRLVNLKFHVDMGPRARIGLLAISGTTPQQTIRLRHSVQSWRARLTGGLMKPGKVYSFERIKDAVSRMKKSLASQDFLASKITTGVPVYHPETNRADVSFRVDPGAKVIIRITGARLTFIPFLSGREERKLIPIYSEGAVDRDLVDQGQQNLLEYFQKKGCFDVKVDRNLQRQPAGISIIYAIDKGKKYKVASITFQGNHALSADNLLEHIPVKRARFFFLHGTFSAQLLRTSVTNIQALYQNVGYEEAKVTPETRERNRNLNVIFQIVEGPQTMVKSVNVLGNTSISYSELAKGPGFQLRSGAPFSPGKLKSDRNQIIAAYLDQGYPNVEVKTEVRRLANDPHRLDVTYAITQNQIVRIHKILYAGQQHTRTWLLRRTSNLRTEAPLNQRQLLQSETQLYDLGIFDWASVEPKQAITDQRQEDMLVRVHEAKRTEINYGFGFDIEARGGTVPTGTVAVPGLPPISVGNHQVAPSQGTYASPRGSIELVRRNMRGLGQTASFSILASRLDYRGLASYTDPHLIGTNWSGLTSLSYERTTENPLFGATLEIASVQLERILNQKAHTTLQLRYDFNHTTLSELLVPDLVLPQDRNVKLSTVSGALIRDTRDHPLDAHKGVFETLNLGVTPTAFGSSANFTRLFGQYATYKPLLGTIWANSIRLGLAKAFSNSFVPTSELFFAGGSTTLRGFPIDGAGPQRIVPFCNVLTGTTGCVNISVPVGGRQLFIFNSEIRFPLKMIMRPLGGVVFYDGGNVYNAINFHQFTSNYTNTVGLGLRYSTPIGPIRFDVGRNLNPVPGISATQYFITLGQAF